MKQDEVFTRRGKQKFYKTNLIAAVKYTYIINTFEEYT